MTNVTITEDQIIAAAEELAEFVLGSTDQYHVKETNFGIKYYTYYLTAGQEVGIAYVVSELLAGRSTTLKVCGVRRPKNYVDAPTAWAITRDISSRATRILRDANERARSVAVIESFAKQEGEAANPRSLAVNN